MTTFWIRAAGCLAIALAGMWTGLTERAVYGCDHCAATAPCRKVCRLVCEQKKIEVTCWGCEVEEFCVPGRSKVAAKHCETVCDVCEQPAAEGPATGPKKFIWREWIPGGAKMQTRKKLMKKTVIKTIPSYKWVVEDLCESCEMNLPQVAIPPDAVIPPRPADIR